MPNLLTASGLASAHSAAYSSLGCDVGQACNSTAVEFQFAMLQAGLALGLLNTKELSQLLPAEAWGITLQPSCADGGVRLILPEPVVRLNGSAPTAALFHLTLDGDVAVLNAAALVGPRQIGGSTVYVIELSPELIPPSGGKSLSLRIEEETLVAPLRGLMPRMTLSTTLADCLAPSMNQTDLLSPGLTGPGCPWLGGLMASALMAALSLLEFSWRLLPRKGRIGRGRPSSISIAPEPTPAIPLPRGQSSECILPRETLPSSPPSRYRTRTRVEDDAKRAVKTPAAESPPMRLSRSTTSCSSSTDLCSSSSNSSRSSSRNGHRHNIDPLTRAWLGSFSVAKAAVGDKPKLSMVVWIVSVAASACLLALASARRVVFVQTVVPLLPVWFAQSYLLSGQCGQRQSGRALLPALRTLGICAMSIAVAVVTAIPSATDLLPLRRLLIVGPAAFFAALFIAVDAVFSRQPYYAFKKLGPEAWGSLALLAAVLAVVVGVPPFALGGSFPCHSIEASVFGTVTALLAPLSLGLLWRVRRSSIGLNASLAPRQAPWRRAYRNTVGKKPPYAPAGGAREPPEPNRARIYTVEEAEAETEAEVKLKAAEEARLAIQAKVANVVLRGRVDELDINADLRFPTPRSATRQLRVTLPPISTPILPGQLRVTLPPISAARQPACLPAVSPFVKRSRSSLDLNT